jgi:hypothetical protein
MGLFTLAGLKAAAPIIAGGIGYLGSQQRNKAAQRAAANQMSFQQNMSNTSYQRGMEDMKKAGLNPILAGKMGGASTPGGATYQPENVGMAAQQSFANVANVMANTAKTEAETKLLKTTGNAIIPRNIEGIKRLIQEYSSSVVDLANKSLREKAARNNAMKSGGGNSDDLRIRIPLKQNMRPKYYINGTRTK